MRAGEGRRVPFRGAWADRLGELSWRSLVVTATLVGLVIVSAAGAWAVRSSWLEHQRAVETALDEYAAYAARAFDQAATAENIYLRARSMAAVNGALAFPGDGPTLEHFAAEASRVLDPAIALADDPLRGFFRIDERTGRYDGVGAAAHPDVERLMRRLALERRPGIDTASTSLQAIAEIGGVKACVHLAMRRGADGSPLAIYGFTCSWRRSFEPMAERLLRRTLLLPPSLTESGAEPAVLTGLDTLIALRVALPGEDDYYRTPAQFTSDATTSYRRPGSSAVINATLHPVLVDRLRASMLNDTRRRLQFALPILTLLLAAATVLHLRRERELVRARRDFVASVSHDLRTPLAQIRMFSETLMLKREESEEERLRWLAVIGREARRLGDLVENILLFSHIDAARVRLEPERTDIGELVEEVVEAYVPVAASLHMRIVADAPSRIYALVDPRALRQVVVNLIDNALKYGPVGQTVSVEVEREGTTARIAVSDKGPGVPPADRARLWRPFVRLTGTAAAAGGSGIGLSVVRTLVEQHGGTVAVQDASGGGARFLIALPLAAATSAPEATRTPPLVSRR